MLETLRSLPIPRVDVRAVQDWFGTVKAFPHVELLVDIIQGGAPVAVAAGGNLPAALAYGNHASVSGFSRDLLDKICDDVLMGRAFVFPRSSAPRIEGLRISPVTVVASASKVRVCHDLSADVSGTSVNADTDPSAVPECKIGHVLRDVLWRILYLHGAPVANAPGPPPRILLAKMDTKSAFRQVSVRVRDSPVFSYVFDEFVVVDRCLQFGWTSSPSLWDVCASALCGYPSCAGCFAAWRRRSRSPTA